jgi:signal transduction histidine kinase
MAPTSIITIVEETVDLARADIERHDIALRVDIANDLPLVLADRLQIEQVLLNLMRNSIEAIAEAGAGRGQITIDARRSGPGLLELTVSDTGPGFRSPFFEDVPLPLTSTKPDGLGIGLPLCRSIAEAHGGKLSIRTTGRGASVSISLPTAGGGVDG